MGIFPYLGPVIPKVLTKPATGKTPVGRTMPMLENVVEVMDGVADCEVAADIGC